ncbi:MAG: hypothetical protein H8E72_00345 [Candidatus Marinimicrobia bacterium]|nr:hypothetical protein [Candidatus Neomarinimicrobiota bacterium]
MNSFVKVLVATLIGSALGYAYYYFIGCNSGTCAITSRPVNSTTYGAFMGFVWHLPEILMKDKKSQ